MFPKCETSEGLCRGGYVSVPKQSCGSWTLFVCKHFCLVFVHILRTEIWASNYKWNYTCPPLIYSAESCIGFSWREEGKQHAAKLQLSVPTNSCTHVFKLLNTINTDFELKKKNLSATVHNKLPRHLESPQYCTTFKGEHMNKHGEDTYAKTQIFPHYQIRTAWYMIFYTWQWFTV